MKPAALEAALSPHFPSVTIKSIPIPPQYYKSWTNIYLQIGEGIAQRIPKAEDAPPGLPITRETFLQMFEAMQEEVRQAVVICGKEITTILAQ
jgi:hypothetical protein